MKKLAAIAEESFQITDDISNVPNPINNVPVKQQQPPPLPTTPQPQSQYHSNGSNGANGFIEAPSQITRPSQLIMSPNTSMMATNLNHHPFPGESPARNGNNSSASPLTGVTNHVMSESTCTTPMTPDDSDVPPRPPPRKKASFSKSRPLPTVQVVSTPEIAPAVPLMDNQENHKPVCSWLFLLFH